MAGDEAFEQFVEFSGECFRQRGAKYYGFVSNCLGSHMFLQNRYSLCSQITSGQANPISVMIVAVKVD